ncbi:SufD family Fe-S cluster assembly protein, partial [Myxococcota bacterium]|nr:SufD family Fe-S cluster assembly protein [Myxococcota bacterium]
DDVKCAHGATVARIEGDALFYLQARGISKKDARHMLMDAFARDSLEAISDKTVREAMQEFGSHTLRELDV